MKIDTNHKEHIWIRQLKNGSHKAFDEIYHMYAKELYAYSVQFTKSGEDAEEIVQDVFVRIWQNRHNIRQNETLRSLLFIMAKNLLINSYRAKVNHPVYEEYVEYMDVSEENTSPRIEYDEFSKKVYNEIERLPDTQRKIVILSRFENCSNKEIAKIISLSEQTVKNQLSLGLKTLRGKLYELL